MTSTSALCGFEDDYFCLLPFAFCTLCVQRNRCDFRRAVQSRVDVNGSNAARSIDLGVLYSVQSHAVNYAHWWQDKGTDKRQSDLAAVAMAGELQVDWERCNQIFD